MAYNGTLKVQVTSGQSYIPIEDAEITITPIEEATNRVVPQTIKTNKSGLTQLVELPAPSLDYSMKPSDKLPYSLCNIDVKAPGYQNLSIKGCQVLPNVTAVQQCNLKQMARGMRQEEVIVVQPNRLVGNFPPKIPESPEKSPSETGFVVLDQPVVPGIIVVHAGLPDDNSAPNYYVPFKDYVKNVASSEIFATWPDSTIRANIYCILSFTLNRIYTEWYRGKGKPFDITNSTAFDHAFTYGRNIYGNISAVVDQIFTSYLRRSGRKQPLLTQYCDGVKVQCPGWLTQWGSKYLGDKGRVPFEILTDFYGTDLEMMRADKVKGIPKSYPGYTLRIGSTGDPVRTVQTYLNRIAQNYPAIPRQAVDGNYGKGTAESVRVFQGIFGLPQTGNVDYGTWYKISDVYVGVTKIAELRGETEIELENENIEKRLFVSPSPYQGMMWNPVVEYPIDDDNTF